MEYYAVGLALAATGYVVGNKPKQDQKQDARPGETRRGFSAYDGGAYWTNPRVLRTVDHGIGPHIRYPRKDRAWQNFDVNPSREGARRIGRMRANNRKWGRREPEMHSGGGADKVPWSPVFPPGKVPVEKTATKTLPSSHYQYYRSIF